MTRNLDNNGQVQKSWLNFQENTEDDFLFSTSEDHKVKKNVYCRQSIIVETRVLPWQQHRIGQCCYLQIINSIYYMALSHKDWELPNARI